MNPRSLLAYLFLVYFFKPTRATALDNVVAGIGSLSAVVFAAWFVFQNMGEAASSGSSLGKLAFAAFAMYWLCTIILGMRSVAESRQQPAASGALHALKVVFLYILLPITILSTLLVLFAIPR